MFKNGQTNLYNTLMGNPILSNSTNNSVGRYAGNTGSSDNFFTKKAKSIENALGTTAATLIGGVNEKIVNDNRDNLVKDQKTRMNDIAKKYGYNTYQDVWDAKDAAEASGDTETLNKINNIINPELQAQANANAKEANKFASDYKDYVKNDYIGQKTNQDNTKFLGSAINTMSTATDVLGLTNGPLANAIQGGIEGIADELEQNGGTLDLTELFSKGPQVKNWDNFDWARAGQNALTGAASGAVTGALNKGLSNSLAKKGGNLFKGNNMVTRGLNNLGSNTALGRIGSTIATGAGRGALSGAVGGATGAGLSAALNNQDVLGSALQGAVQGAKSGAATGGIMAGANMAINKTPGVGKFLRDVNQAQQDWKNSGDSFDERLTNTLTSGDSAVGEWLQGNRQSKLLGTAGNIGNRIVMEDGKPKPFYHGSPVEDIEEFDLAKAGKNTRSGEKAIFFTDDQPTAEEFSYERIPTDDIFVDEVGKKGKVYTRNLDLENPLDLGKLTDAQIDELWDYAAPIAKMDGKEKFVRNMKDFGQAGNDQLIKSQLDLSLLRESPYDGIIAKMYPGQNDVREYGVFDTNKIVNPETVSDQQTPTTLGGWLKKAGQRVVEDVNNRGGVGMSVKDVSNTTEAPRIDPWDRLAQQNGYRNYDEVIQRYMEANPNAKINPRGMAGAITTWMDNNPGDYNPNSPTTATGWLKKAGSKLLDSAKNRGVGMSIQDVANKQDGYSDDIRNMKINDGNIFQETAVEEPPVAQQTTTNRRARTIQPEIAPEEQMNVQESPETEVYRTLANSKTGKNAQLKNAAGLKLQEQYGTIDKPTAKATNAPETLQKIANAGFIKPADVERMADVVTGSNGEVSGLVSNLVKTAKPVNTFDGETSSQTLDDYIDSRINRRGLDGINEGKAVKSQINALMKSLPSHSEGSLTFNDDPAEVFKVTQELDAEAAQYEGRTGMNYGTTTPDKLRAAQVIKDVSQLLKNRIYDTVDVKNALTPEVAENLKSYAPNNKEWADYVDNNIMKATNIKDLRSAQKPWVDAKKIIDNGYMNSITYGGRVGNTTAIPTTKRSLIGSALNATVNSGPGLRMQYKILNKAADLVPDRNTTPGVGANTGNAPGNTGNTPTPVETPTTTTTRNPSMNIYNAIGRQEGLSQGEQARVADYLTQANQNTTTPTTSNTLGVDNGATTLYNAMNGGTMSTASTNPTNGYQSITGEFNTLEEERANYFFPPTGDYWSDMLSRAMRRAKNAEDYTALGSLYEMYQEATSKKSSEKDNSNPVNWSSSDRSSLLKAQNGLDQVDQLEQAYTNAVGEGSNGIQGTLRQWANNLSFGNADPSAENYVKQANSIGAGIIKNLVNLGSTEYDAQRYIDYLPKLTDTKEQASQKLQALKNAYQSVINNLYNVYAV